MTVYYQGDDSDYDSDDIYTNTNTPNNMHCKKEKQRDLIINLQHQCGVTINATLKKSCLSVEGKACCTQGEGVPEMVDPTQ